MGQYSLFTYRHMTVVLKYIKKSNNVMIDEIIIIILLVCLYSIIPVVISLVKFEFDEIKKLHWFVLVIIITLLIGMINCWFSMGKGINIQNPQGAAISSITFSSMTLLLSLILFGYSTYKYVQNGIYMHSSQA